MEKDGYSRRFAAAITAASSVIGPTIPPSIIMVVYGLVMNVSVAGLFAAGIAPGILMGGGLMIATVFIARKRNYPKRYIRAPAREIAVSCIVLQVIVSSHCERDRLFDSNRSGFDKIFSHTTYPRFLFAELFYNRAVFANHIRCWNKY